MKVLVISHNSFSKTHNNGKTLSAIFSAFSQDELCQLYFTPIGVRDYDRCTSYFTITDRDALKSILKSRKHVDSSSLEKNMDAKWVPTKQSDIKMFVRSLVWEFSNWKGVELKKWLEIQSPDLIFFYGGNSIFSHRIAVNLAEELQIPLVTYFADDYVINPPLTLYGRLLRRTYKKTIEKSTMLYAIGKQMAEDYSRYYNRNFTPIMNIVDIPETIPWISSDGGKIKICYYGGLHLGRGEEIISFVTYLRNTLPDVVYKSIEFRVYTFSIIGKGIEELFQELGVLKFNGLTGSALKKSMIDADIFLHVESSKPQFHCLTKLSVSTKIPEYMSYAKPIIAYGPSDVASFRVISEVNEDLVIDEAKIDSYKIDVLYRLLTDVEKRKEYGLNNYGYSKRNFDKVKVSRLFKNTIESIISTNK